MQTIIELLEALQTILDDTANSLDIDAHFFDHEYVPVDGELFKIHRNYRATSNGDGDDYYDIFKVYLKNNNQRSSIAVCSSYDQVKDITGSYMRSRLSALETGGTIDLTNRRTGVEWSVQRAACEGLLQQIHLGRLRNPTL